MITPLVYDQVAAVVQQPPIVTDLSIKPPTEIALFHLQSEYFKTRSLDVWKQMFKICYDYARSLVLKRLKGKIFIDPDEVNDTATGAAVAFMRQYQVKPDWKVTVSFAGMLKWKVIESMYRSQKEDDHVSLNAVSERSEKGDELQDSLARLGFTSLDGSYNPKPEDMLDKVSLREVIDPVLAELRDSEVNEREYVLALLKLVIVLKKPKNRHVKVNFENRWELDYKTYGVVERTELEVRSRVKEMVSRSQ